jgi:hypothetical protein
VFFSHIICEFPIRKLFCVNRNSRQNAAKSVPMQQAHDDVVNHVFTLQHDRDEDG